MQDEVLNLTIIIPVYNPDERLIGVVDGLVEKGFRDIIVVNDGSDTEHQDVLKSIESKCTLIHHKNKRGREKAVATAAAFCMANRQNTVGAIIAKDDKGQRAEEIYACGENFVKNEYQSCDNVVSRRIFRLLHGLKQGEAVSFEEKKSGRYKTMLVNYRGIG